MRERPYTLITGGAGFVGSNLADGLLREGEQVVVLDDFSREGAELNASWLLSEHGSGIRVEVGSVADAGLVRALVCGANRVFHLAAQVAVTRSLADPRLDLESNLLGTFNVLEAARAMPTPPSVLFASTNKVYGEMRDVPIARIGDSYRYADGRTGIGEDMQLDFHSPYGCSKGAADQYVRDYARTFAVPTAVFRMSCVYGNRQFGTEDQGWIAHFARAIRKGAAITIFGDGYQVRDVLWVGDLVDAMRRALARADQYPGEIYNVGGGAVNAVSVRAVIDRLMEITRSTVPVVTAGWRPGDQRVYISDTTKADRLLGWRPTTRWEDGLVRLVQWLDSAEEAGIALPWKEVDSARVAAVGL